MMFSPELMDLLRARMPSAAPAGIPGLTAPVAGGGGLPTGMANPHPQLPQMPASQFQAYGPYGSQAMQMAGLLGQPQQMNPQALGLLGGRYGQ